MQANFGSIIGMYGKKAQIAVTKLLQSNLIHFLGSDVHRSSSIYTKIPEILQKLVRLIGTQRLEELTTLYPKQVLKNETIQIHMPKIPKYTIKEKLLMQF